MALGRLVLGPPRAGHAVGGGIGEPDGVELYHRTYTTLLRSRGETHLRVLEPSHRAMRASLHPMGDDEQLDLGAFLYAVRRLPDGIVGAELILMGQEHDVFRAAGIDLTGWRVQEAVARRRHWYDSGSGMLAVLLASASDVDDLVPILVAFQIERNKLHSRLRAAGWSELPDDADPESCAGELGGVADDWRSLQRTWGPLFAPRLQAVAARKVDIRVRMLGGTHIGYARLTRKWWGTASTCLEREHLSHRPIYFVSSNTHSLANLVTGIAREREHELVSFVERAGSAELREELAAFRDGRTPGSWENFLYFVARDYFDIDQQRGSERRTAERAAGVTHLHRRSRCECRSRSSRWRGFRQSDWTRAWARSTPPCYVRARR